MKQWQYLNIEKKRITATSEQVRVELLNGNLSWKTELYNLISKQTTTVLDLLQFKIEPEPIQSYKKMSIICLGLTLNPLFIISIFASNRAEELNKYGKRKEALKQAKLTKKLNLTFISITIVFFILSLIKVIYLIQKVSNELFMNL